MSNPDQLAHDIDGTRNSLRDNVGRLNEQISPTKVVNRRVDRLKNGAGTIKEKLMGYADNSDGSVTDAISGKVGSATSSIQDATSAAADKLSGAGGATQNAKDQAQGNPLAAGVIAFGVGLLLSALVPASSAEQQAARRLQDSDAVTGPLKESAQEVAGNLQQPLQDSAAALKSTATDAANKTADHARSAAAETADHARSAAAETTDHAKDAASSTADQARGAAEDVKKQSPSPR